MIINLYHNASDKNVMDKSLSEVGTLSGSLRDSCSVTDPTILIEGGNFSSVNYFYIPEFNRYYYVVSIVSIRTGVWSITGHVDVLMSYRSQIRRLGAVISRAEDNGIANLYLPDDKLLVTSRRDFSLKTFPGRVATSGKQFVITIAGGSS